MNRPAHTPFRDRLSADGVWPAADPARRQGTILPALVSTAVAVALLAGCSAAPRPVEVQQSPASPARVDPEIERAAAAFPEPLPEGIQWPTSGIDFSDPAVNPEQTSVVPHSGMNDEYVAGYWLCSWMDVYLKAVDDPQKRNEAVSNLAKYTSLPIVQQNLGNPEHFEASIVAPARLGDSAAVSEYYGASCRDYKDR